METSLFNIPGMDCPVEEKLVRAALAPITGIQSLRFNLIQRKLRIEHAADDLPAITKALASLDMGATLVQEETSQAPQAETAPNWKRLGIALGLAFLSELVELYGEWRSADPGVWQFISLLCAVAAIALSGLVTYKKGWLAVRHLNLNINALMAVAVTGAALIGQWPEAAMVMALFNISEAIEARALSKARNAIGDLVALAPTMAEVAREDGTFATAPVAEVRVGQRVRVAPGEKIPLDGVVVSGASSVNQAPITGESMPVPKKTGDFLYAGTLNENGSLEFRVTSLSGDTTLARIIHTVEEAQATRAPMQRFVDVFSTWYTPIIFLIALLCALIPPIFMGVAWKSAIYTGLVLLVIGCPCALVISTPVSIVCAMANAAKNGILIKGGVFLEQGRRLVCMALDKTGTLTRGKPVVTDFICADPADEKKARQLAASLAARSDHPVSRAIIQAAALLMPLKVENFTAVPGAGVKGTIDGKEYGLGNLRMNMGEADPSMLQEIRKLESAGKTVSELYGPNGIIALIAAADTLRETTKPAMTALASLGVQVVMLTGDNELAAKAIAREAGITEVKAGLLPGQKLEAVEDLEQKYGPTGMVGDGINDAPALAKATISFAMAQEGTDTAIETADVALMDDDLDKLPAFIRLSRSTFAILIENIAIALAIKAVFFVLALWGLATMWMAVFADVGAALIVIGNGMRLLRK